MSELPQLLCYPPALTDIQAVSGLYCYILDHYGEPGIAALFRRDRESGIAALKLGDWFGRAIDPADECDALHTPVVEFLGSPFRALLALISAAAIDQIQLFLSKDLVLVDAQIYLGKFVGPGMLNDSFGRVVSTCRVRSIEVLGEEEVRAIGVGEGKYSGDLIIKPSRFRCIDPPSDLSPLYVQVRR